MSIARPDNHELITLLWDVEGRVRYARESILPSGHVELLFNLGDAPSLLEGGDPARKTRFATTWVSGLQQRNIVVESTGYSHLLGVRLTPLGAWRLLGIPLEELRDEVVDADLVAGRRMLELRSELERIIDPADRMSRLARFVLERMDEGPDPHHGVVRALGYVRSKRGAVPVSTLVDLAECSHRHLVRKFREQIGVTPKRYAEILRLQRAVECLKANPSTNLAELALDCGYYDQAHFNRDFRQFSGTTPRAFAASILPDEVTDSMILD